MRWPHVLITRYRSYPSDGWSDPISGRNVAQGGAVINQLETGEAPEAVSCRSDLQKELAEVLRQRAAISAVLRAIASSPDLRGDDIARIIQLYMACAPEPPFNSAAPETAPAAILKQARQSVQGIADQREATARRVAARLGIRVPANLG